MNILRSHEDMPTLLSVLMSAGPEPAFDNIARDFLTHTGEELMRHCRRGGLLTAESFGNAAPWLWLLRFATRGLVREPNGETHVAENHVVAVRFLADCLRRVDRFEMLALVEPRQPSAFHPNILADGSAICVEVYPGESLTEIAHSLHALISGRLKMLDEQNALNKDACAYWRQHIKKPFDDRPLFGQRQAFELQIT
jgi:hypothetical protein